MNFMNGTRTLVETSNVQLAYVWSWTFFLWSRCHLRTMWTDDYSSTDSAGVWSERAHFPFAHFHFSKTFYFPFIFIVILSVLFFISLHFLRFFLFSARTPAPLNGDSREKCTARPKLKQLPNCVHFVFRFFKYTRNDGTTIVCHADNI